MSEQRLAWVLSQVEHLTYELYRRVRSGDLSLADTCELLLPTGGETETKEWRRGTPQDHARALLRHVGPALSTLRDAGTADDLVSRLEPLCDEIERWARE
ncbi:MAG: hypothetical protein Q8P18_26835 [Pseudomonadota bacterium]|nr:hypothetical protein [Pseudomonadota bacterium]